MKIHYFLLIFPLLVLSLAITAFVSRNPRVRLSRPAGRIMDCSPSGLSDAGVGADGKFIPPLPGWGNHSYLISTKTDSAQYYFNQGLTMYFSYQFGEAKASFKEAARFDPDCVMAYWGEALSMGPPYNGAHMFKMRKGTREVLYVMNKNRINGTPKEMLLVEVMNHRYSADTLDIRRKELNIAYADGMKMLMKKYPGDLDIAALYVDAVMLIHPWDFWNNDGSPKPWTPELVNICESILKKQPLHPAALHYYIHVTEASRNPQVALASADILKDLLPNVPHMVHMSSHEYERNGLFAKGVSVNEIADQNIMLYDSLSKLFSGRHSSHYFAVQTWCAMSGNMYQQTMPLAFRCRNSVHPAYRETDDQAKYSMPVMAYVRMGKWDEIIADSILPDKEWPLANVLYHFSKGMAFARKGKLEEARKFLDRLRFFEQDSILKVVDTPFNAPIKMARIADKILAASISFEQKKYEQSLSLLKQAILIEDSQIYSEPKDWLIPTRQYLGAYLLQLKKPVEAERVYREDLQWNPGNGWSSLGLYQSLLEQGKAGQASAYRKIYLESFSASDSIPPASVY
jgi:tetratricopeptide (TPR) repeat protein